MDFWKRKSPGMTDYKKQETNTGVTELQTSLSLNNFGLNSLGLFFTPMCIGNSETTFCALEGWENK